MFSNSHKNTKREESNLMLSGYVTANCSAIGQNTGNKRVWESNTIKMNLQKIQQHPDVCVSLHFITTSYNLVSAGF